MRNRRRREVEGKKKRRRTVLFTLGILLIIYFAVSVVFGENGLLRYLQLKSIKGEIQAEIAALKRQNEEMRKKIETAQSDTGRKEELGRKHGFKKEGELIFKFDDEKQLP
jgi:cell division protein FtsB